VKNKKKNLFAGRHFLLYVNGHYHQSTDLMTDIRMLVADYSALKFENVVEMDALKVVGDIVIPLLLESEKAHDEIWKILTSLLEKASFGNFLSIRDFLTELLRFLAQVKVVDEDNTIFELGDPDFSILPRPS